VDKEALIVKCTFRPLREVARECKIPESTLRGWKRKFEEEGVLPKAKKKAIGGGQKPLMPPSVEEKLVEWIHERREAGVAITTYLVRGKALELFHDDNFKASDGWCRNFQKRWNLTTRTPTNQRANANVTVEERNDKVQVIGIPSSEYEQNTISVQIAYAEQMECYYHQWSYSRVRSKIIKVFELLFGDEGL